MPSESRWRLRALRPLLGMALLIAATLSVPAVRAASDEPSTSDGFELSEVSYRLNEADPARIDAAKFTASSFDQGPWPASLSTVLARFTLADAAWFVCTDDAGGAAAGVYQITCVTDGTANGGMFYDGVTPSPALTMDTASEFQAALFE